MAHTTAEMIERGRRSSPIASTHRLRNAQHMKAVREKLTSSGTGQRTFDIELLHLFARNQRIVLILKGFLVAFSAAALAAWPQAPLVLALLGVAAALVAIPLVLARRLTDADLSTTSLKRWQNRFAGSQLAEHLVWSAFAILFVTHGDANIRTFVLLLLLCLSGIGALLASSLDAAFYAGIVPSTCALVFVLRREFDPANLPELVLAVAAQVFCFTVARRLHAAQLADLSVQAERDASMVEIEQSRLNSDEARRRAEEANLAKSRFLATMSHELRTPLNAILGFSEVMKGELFGPHTVAVYKEYANDIHSSGQHLLVLINEILDLSRVEAGRYDLREEPVLLAHIVEDAKHLLALRAHKREITVTDQIERDLPRIWADERAIRQVALNLLSNAIKFTPQGGSVTVKVGWTVERGQYLSIRDTGPGIPEAEIPIVMSSFGRGTLAQKNAEEGSGLGLPIVKGLVEMHGGTFTLKSKVREGTEAIVILPPERIIDAMPQFDPKGSPPPARRGRDGASRAAAA